MIALLAFLLAGPAAAQVTPIPQFVGDYQEGWESGFPVLPCIPVAGGALGDVCSGTMIATSGWGFFCSLSPHSGGGFVGSAAGVATFDFPYPMQRFGGWFNTNADDGTGWTAIIRLYDTNGVMLYEDIVPINNCGSWVWLGYESTERIGSVTVDGNLWGGGFAMMDDLEFTTFPDADNDGFETGDGDCDDLDPNVYPGALEICDGRDNDCDGYLPPNEADNDSDGVSACTDCDDTDPTAYPGAIEQCDGVDDDCDGQIDLPAPNDDNDPVSLCDGDCDDRDPAVYPGASEICDGLDNNCDGVLPADENDADFDGARACIDCDEGNANISPFENERCDALDTDCDGFIDPREFDDDGDGRATCAGDCDDTDINRSPELAEVCDGIDNDCSGQPDPDELDVDGDGIAACDDDCDDDDATIYPGATEVSDDGVDQDCDGADAVTEGDTDDPTLDQQPDDTAKASGGCGCTSAPGPAGLAPWLALVALIGRRRALSR